MEGAASFIQPPPLTQLGHALTHDIFDGCTQLDLFDRASKFGVSHGEVCRSEGRETVESSDKSALDAALGVSFAELSCFSGRSVRRGCESYPSQPRGKNSVVASAKTYPRNLGTDSPQTSTNEVFEDSIASPVSRAAVIDTR